MGRVGTTPAVEVLALAALQRTLMSIAGELIGILISLLEEKECSLMMQILSFKSYL